MSWKKKKGCVAVTDERTWLNENVVSWTGSDSKIKMLKDIVGTTDKNRTGCVLMKVIITSLLTS